MEPITHHFIAISAGKGGFQLVDLMFSKFQVPTDHWEYNIPPGRGWPEVSHVTNSLGFGFLRFYAFLPQLE